MCPAETLGVAVVEMMMLLNLEHSLTRENGARDTDNLHQCVVAECHECFFWWDV